MGIARTILWAAALSVSFSSHVIAGGEGDKIGDTGWELTRTPDGNFYRLVTHGTAVWGHEIGALFPAADCEQPNLWVSWSAFDARLNKEAEGSIATFAFASSDQQTLRDLPLLLVWRPFGGTDGTALLTFTSRAMDNDLSEFLRTHETLNVQISAPDTLISLLDFVEDEFDIRGFAIAEETARNACRARAKL